MKITDTEDQVEWGRRKTDKREREKLTFNEIQTEIILVCDSEEKKKDFIFA